MWTKAKYAAGYVKFPTLKPTDFGVLRIRRDSRLPPRIGNLTPAVNAPNA